MLDLHNWNGSHASGAPDPATVVARYDVVAICVDYLQSFPNKPEDPPYDFGYYQALDALRALWWVGHGLDAAGIPFAHGRTYAAGGSGGGNVSLMANKLAPRTFACIVDMSGMAKLSDDFAFNLPGGTPINARYSMDPDSPRYLSMDAQALRFVGNPEHLQAMKALGNACKIVVAHGVDDASCPVADKREMAANMQAAGLDVEPHFIAAAEVDGKVLKNTEHSLGNRTEIADRFAGKYLAPGSPDMRSRSGRSDFECGDAVRYATPGGTFILDYADGYPVGRFESVRGQ